MERDVLDPREQTLLHVRHTQAAFSSAVSSGGMSALLTSSVRFLSESTAFNTSPVGNHTPLPAFSSLGVLLREGDRPLVRVIDHVLTIVGFYRLDLIASLQQLCEETTLAEGLRS